MGGAEGGSGRTSASRGRRPRPTRPSPAASPPASGARRSPPARRRNCHVKGLLVQSTWQVCAALRTWQLCAALSALRTDRRADQAIGKINRRAGQGTGKTGTSQSTGCAAQAEAHHVVHAEVHGDGLSPAGRRIGVLAAGEVDTLPAHRCAGDVALCLHPRACAACTGGVARAVGLAHSLCVTRAIQELPCRQIMDART